MKILCETGTPLCQKELISDTTPLISTYCMRLRGHEGKCSLLRDIPVLDEKRERRVPHTPQHTPGHVDCPGCDENEAYAESLAYKRNTRNAPAVAEPKDNSLNIWSLCVHDIREKDCEVCNPQFTSAPQPEAPMTCRSCHASTRDFKPYPCCGHCGAMLLPDAVSQSDASAKELALWRSEHDPCPFALENERLTEQVKALSRPASDDEWPKTYSGYLRPSITRSVFNAMLAARLSSVKDNNAC